MMPVPRMMMMMMPVHRDLTGEASRLSKQPQAEAGDTVQSYTAYRSTGFTRGPSREIRRRVLINTADIEPASESKADIKILETHTAKPSKWGENPQLDPGPPVLPPR
eukprot:328996-Rhodomonas_salina.1